MTKRSVKYTDTYEYIELDNGVATVGISEEASDKLGDIYFVELPVAGKIVEVNPELDSNPELVSKSPMDKGWLFKIEILDKDEFENLMDEDKFKKYINET